MSGARSGSRDNPITHTHGLPITFATWLEWCERDKSIVPEAKDKRSVCSPAGVFTGAYKGATPTEPSGIVAVDIDKMDDDEHAERIIEAICDGRLPALCLAAKTAGKGGVRLFVDASRNGPPTSKHDLTDSADRVVEHVRSLLADVLGGAEIDNVFKQPNRRTYSHLPPKPEHLSEHPVPLAWRDLPSVASTYSPPPIKTRSSSYEPMSLAEAAQRLSLLNPAVPREDKLKIVWATQDALRDEDAALSVLTDWVAGKLYPLDSPPDSAAVHAMHTKMQRVLATGGDTNNPVTAGTLIRLSDDAEYDAIAPEDYSNGEYIPSDDDIPPADYVPIEVYESNGSAPAKAAPPADKESDLDRYRRQGREVRRLSSEGLELALRHVRYEVRRDDVSAQDEARSGQDDWHQVDSAEMSHIRELVNAANGFILGKTAKGEYRIGALSAAEFQHRWEALVHRRRVVPFKADYLDGLTWNGESLIADLYPSCFTLAEGQDPELIAAAGWNTMGGIVLRAFTPGAKHDEVITLIGPGGAGKSTFVRQLVPDERYYADIQINSDNKRVQELILGKHVVEISEAAGIRGAGMSRFKQLISANIDDMRLPYEPRPMKYPRTAKLFMTSNDAQPLPPDSGDNRRFVPIRLDAQTPRGPQAYTRMVGYFAANRDQLYAEAVHRLRSGEQPHMPAELYAAQIAAAAELADSPPESDHLREWAENNDAAANGFRYAQLAEVLDMKGSPAAVSKAIKAHFVKRVVKPAGKRCHRWFLREDTPNTQLEITE